MKSNDRGRSIPPEHEAIEGEIVRLGQLIGPLVRQKTELDREFLVRIEELAKRLGITPHQCLSGVMAYIVKEALGNRSGIASRG